MKAAPSEKYEPMSDEILKECDKKKAEGLWFPSWYTGGRRRFGMLQSVVRT